MFFGKFRDKSSICLRFSIDESVLKGCKVLFAAYELDYEGQALVVFRRNRKLYEVNGSHCSCYGLEDQWTPEETTVEALRHRIEKGTLGHFLGAYTNEFLAMLDRLAHK